MYEKDISTSFYTILRPSILAVLLLRSGRPVQANPPRYDSTFETGKQPTF